MNPLHTALALAVLASSLPALATPTVEAHSLPTPPGAVQPLAPGYRPAAVLPQLRLGIPQVRSAEYLSNGHLEVAHAVLLLSQTEASPVGLLALAQKVAARAFAARPGLAEVDLSLYRAEGYAGFGGPLPLFTASVPKARSAEFARLVPAHMDDYERLWLNPVLPESPEAEVSQDAVLLSQGPAEPQDAQPASRLLYRGSALRPLAALTFDDAPHPLYLPLVLDSLRRGGAKATFFVIGRNAEAYPYFVRDMARDGHELANHTYHHVRLVGLSPAQVRDELGRTNQLVYDLTRERPVYFRPPGGRFDPSVIAVARRLNLTTAFWTDDPGDFNNPGAQVLLGRLMRHLRRGGIVLLHDNAPQMPGLLEGFVEQARRAGVELVTLEGIAGDSAAR